MREREDTIKWTMQYCQHYDPSGITMIGGKEPHGHCKAGVNYIARFGDGPGIFQRIPCMNGNKCTHDEQIAACPDWLQRTREQGEARADELDATLNRMRIIGPVISEWRNRKPIGKAEIIKCPVCKGRLHLSQAASNGHVHGRCETEGCVSWME